MNKDAPITMRITPTLKLKLAKIATEEERSLSATIRRAIREYVEKRETKVLGEV
jgi:predicted transcriptional regulator